VSIPPTGVRRRVRIRTRTLNFKIKPYPYPYPYLNFSSFWTRTRPRTSELKTTRTPYQIPYPFWESTPYPHPYPYLKFIFFTVPLPALFPYFLSTLKSPDFYVVLKNLNFRYVMPKRKVWENDRAKRPTTKHTFVVDSMNNFFRDIKIALVNLCWVKAK